MPKGVKLITYELTPLQAASKELGLVIQSGFEFLNSLTHSLKQKLMFLIGQGCQIDGTVIVSYSVKVMDNPAIRQRFSVGLLPYQDVLSDITFRISSWMVRPEYKGIASAFLNIASTLPSRMALSRIWFKFSLLPKYLHTFFTRGTFLTFRGSGTHRLSATWAGSFLFSFLILKFIVTFMGAADMVASLGDKRLVADGAKFMLFHTLIIYSKAKQCQ